MTVNELMMKLVELKLAGKIDANTEVCVPDCREGGSPTSVDDIEARVEQEYDRTTNTMIDKQIVFIY